MFSKPERVFNQIEMIRMSRLALKKQQNMCADSSSKKRNNKIITKSKNKTIMFEVIFFMEERMK